MEHIQKEPQTKSTIYPYFDKKIKSEHHSLNQPCNYFSASCLSVLLSCLLTDKTVCLFGQRGTMGCIPFQAAVKFIIGLLIYSRKKDDGALIDVLFFPFMSRNVA